MIYFALVTFCEEHQFCIFQHVLFNWGMRFSYFSSSQGAVNNGPSCLTFVSTRKVKVMGEPSNGRKKEQLIKSTGKP
jgi:hypothetical protein